MCDEKQTASLAKIVLGIMALLIASFACDRFVTGFMTAFGRTIEYQGNRILEIASAVFQWSMIIGPAAAGVSLLVYWLMPRFGEYIVARAEARLANKEANRDIIANFGGSEAIVRYEKNGSMTIYDPTGALVDRVRGMSGNVNDLPGLLAGAAGIVHPPAAGRVGRIENNYNNDGVALLTDPVLAEWPQKVNLFDLLSNRRGDANNLVLGVNVNQDTGKKTVIRVPLEEMVHEASGGETGTGKSTLAYAIAYQLATAPQDVSLVLADPAGTTWKTLSQCDRLRYPVVSSDTDLLHVLGELLRETERRTNELFAPYPTVEKLSEYNALGGQPLGYIVVMIDEFPEYMENRDIEVLVRRLVRKSRKAGVFIFAMGTSWKATDMDTSIKRQFRTKIHFAASDVQSSNVLLGSRVAADLKEPGRAYARLPFGTSADLVEMQCVYLDKNEAMEMLSPRSILELPVAANDGPSVAEQAVIEAYQNGESENQCYRIYHRVSTGAPWPEGKRLGSQHTKQIKTILRKYDIPLRDQG